MSRDDAITEGQFMHIVTLECKDAEHVQRCIVTLANYGRPDAIAFYCISYNFGLKDGTTNIVCLIGRWRRWSDLDDLFSEKVVPALPMYNQFLNQPFDPV